MPYRLFLFDLDHTLFDFEKAEGFSLKKLLDELRVPGDFSKHLPQYQDINERFWTAFARGEFTKEFIKVERFRVFFDANDWDLDPEHAAQRYLTFLAETGDVMDSAIEVVSELRKHAKIGIVTNGVKDVQFGKLTRSGLNRVVDFVIVSEECGFQKPDPRIFEHALKVANHDDPSSVLMVGDRLEMDIKGARDSGIDSCWFNPKKTPNTSDIIPTYEIAHLSEIQESLFQP